jgi:hypothetical protein
LKCHFARSAAVRELLLNKFRAIILISREGMIIKLLVANIMLAIARRHRRRPFVRVLGTTLTPHQLGTI